MESAYSIRYPSRVKVKVVGVLLEVFREEKSLGGPTTSSGSPATWRQPEHHITTNEARLHVVMRTCFITCHRQTDRCCRALLGSVNGSCDAC